MPAKVSDGDHTRAPTLYRLLGDTGGPTEAVAEHEMQQLTAGHLPTTRPPVEDTGTAGLATATRTLRR